MAAVLHASASLALATRDASFARSAPKSFPLRRGSSPNLKTGTTFATGSPLVLSKPTGQMKHAMKPNAVSIRCEQSTQGSNNLDVWLGRLAMVGFAIAISVEISTGKGLLENFGVTAPLPSVALGVTALVGILTAVFIFQSASKN